MARFGNEAAFPLPLKIMSHQQKKKRKVADLARDTLAREKKLEKVQKRVTEMINGLEQLTRYNFFWWGGVK